MPKTSIPKNIRPAGYGKITLGFFIDAMLSFILMYVLYATIGQLVLAPAMNRATTESELSSYLLESKLCDEKGNTWNYEASFVEEGETVYGYKKYEKALWQYYTVFLLNNPNAGFFSEDGLPAGELNYEVVGDWVMTKVYSLTKQTDGSYIAIGEAKNVQPYYHGVYADGVYGIVINDGYSLPEKASELMSFYSRPYTTSSRQGAYVDCLEHIKKQTYYQTHVNRLDNIRYLTTVPGIIGAPLIFFLLIPAFVPNGKTIGKLIAGTAVLGGDGYKAKKINIILHYFIILAFFQTLLIPSLAIGIMAFMLIFVIDYVVLILNKNHQSLHDLISQTIVINSKESTWFASSEEEEEYIATHPSSYVATLRETPMERSEDGRKLVVDDSAIAAMDSILDLSTIDKNRREAREMTSFDEFEKKKEEEFAAMGASKQEEAEVDEKELADAAALEGLTPEELEELSHEDEEVEENGDFADKGKE